MKKKLLLTLLLISILVCMFAVAVSATTYVYKDTDGNTLYQFDAAIGTTNKRYELIDFSTVSGEGFAKTDASGNALTWYVVADDNGTETRTITVDSIKTVETGTVADGKFTYGSTVTANKVISANFTNDMGISTFGSIYQANASSKPHNSEYCEIADGSYLLFLYLPSTLTAIPNSFIERTPVTVLEFYNNSMTGNDIAIPDSAFRYAANLRSLVFPEGVTTLKAEGCREMHSLEYVKFPSTMTTLPDNVFRRSNSIKTVVLGANMTNIGRVNTDYKTYQATHANQMKFVYIPNTITAFSSAFDVYEVAPANKIVYYFAGTKQEAQALGAIAGGLYKTAASNEDTLISYEVYIENKATYDNYSNDIVVYGYNTCEAFYDGIHDMQEIEGNTCQGVCNNCGNTELLANPSHTNVWIFTDTEGNEMNVSADIFATCKCEFCGTVEDTETIATIFKPLGYTQPEDGTPYLGYEVKVDQTALARYEELSGNEVKYGLLAGIATETSDNTPLSLDENGKLVADNNSTVIVNMSESNYTVLQIKITGINTTTSLYCNAFAVVGTDISYICETASNTATKKDITVVTE